MVMNIQNSILILILVYFLAYEPVVGLLTYRKFVRRQMVDSTERIRYYGKLLGGLWFLVACVFAFMLFYGFSLGEVGINRVTLRFSELNKLFVIIVATAALGLFLLLVYQLIAARLSIKYRQKLMNTDIPQDISILLPDTNGERKLWTVISITAGLTEEFLYRGFLSLALTQLFPAINLPLTAIICSIIFGLGHTYQGVSGVVKTGLLGLFFHALYIATGSIIPGVLLHFAIDLSAKDTQKYNEKNITEKT